MPFPIGGKEPAAVEKRDKLEAVKEVLNGLDSRVRELERVVRRLKGETDEESEQDEVAPEPFSIFWAGLPSDLNSLADRLVSVRNGLNEIIYG